MLIPPIVELLTTELPFFGMPEIAETHRMRGHVAASARRWSKFDACVYLEVLPNVGQ